MAAGFIGQEVFATTSQELPSPTATTAAQQQQQQQLPSTADTQTDPSTTYIPVDKLVSEVDAVHNTLLVGLLIALVAASVGVGCLTMYCLRRRAQKKTQRKYQAELHEMQKKEDEDRAARSA